MAANMISKNNETDDYTLEPVPQEARRKWMPLFIAICGTATALFFMQLGSLMAINYGIANAIFSLIYATVIGGLLGYAISYISAKTGMGINLIGRATGYGHVGITIVSLIYGVTLLLYFALEGSIMASALHTLIPSIPLWLIMLVIGLGMIPLNWYGIRLIEKFQKWTFVFYLIMLVIAIYISINAFSVNSSNWEKYMPVNMPFGGEGLLACIGVMNGAIAIQTLVTGDYARFVKKENLKIGSFFIGFATQISCFLIAGLFGIWFGVNYLESNPGVFFVTMLGVWGVIFAIVTQIRINLSNLYVGSVSIASFASQLFKFTPGRVFWSIICSVVATISMIAGLIHYMEFLVTLSGVFLMAIVTTIVTDFFIIRKIFKIGSEKLEYQPHKLRAWNPIGIGSLIISGVLGTFMIFGVFGSFWEPIATLAAATINIVLYVSLTVLTKGKFYVAKTTEIDNSSVTTN